MDNFSPTKSPKRKYSSAIIAVIVCAAIVAGAVAIAILNPEGGFDLLPSLTGDTRQKTHFTDIKYEHPDTEALIKDFDTLIDMIKNGKSFTEQRSLYNKINIDYTNFMTMLNLAYIGFSTDTSDEFYSGELSDLEKASVTVRNKLNLLHDTIAASNFKTNYERSYYGVGYFTDWENLVYSDEVTALMEKENQLIDSYRELMADPVVVVNNKTIHINKDLDSLSEKDTASAIWAYYQKYNSLAGDIYVDLVKIRLEIAEKLGKSYTEYAYDNLGRDFSPDEAADYLENVAEYIIPVIEQIEYDGSSMLGHCDPSSSLYAVSHGANNMKGVIADAFDYMFELGLYNIGYSELKSRSSFTTYLYNNNVPYLFVSPECTAEDFFTLSHEFGHFVDAYHNKDFEANIDAAEIPSRAMEYIMPYYTNSLRGYSRDELTKYSLYTAAEIYTVQSFISSFESKIYTLSPDEIDLNKLNSIAYECAEKFGLSAMSELYRYAWIDITHIFEAPFYTVSYIIANDVALQVLEAELNSPGKGGVDAFVKVITRDDDLTFVEQLADSGFKSPFNSERVRKIASMLEDAFITPEETPESQTDTQPIESIPSNALALPAA